MEQAAKRTKQQLQAKVVSLQSSLDEEKAKLEEATSTIERLEDDLEQGQLERDKETRRTELLEKAAATKDAEVAVLKKEINDQQSQIAKLKAQVKVLETQVQQQQLLGEGLEQSEQALQNHVLSLQATLEKAKVHVCELSDDATGLRSFIKTLEDRLKTLEDRLAQKRTEKAELEKQLKKKDREIDVLKVMLPCCCGCVVFGHVFLVQGSKAKALNMPCFGAPTRRLLLPPEFEQCQPGPKPKP
jgi:chromosome segregation ATPase